MNYAAYDALPGVRATSLKRLAESPLHYRSAEDKDSYTRIFLRAIHCLTLEPHRFEQDFAIYGGGSRRNKGHAVFCLANEGKQVLAGDEPEKARAIAAAILAHPVAGPLFTGPGNSEMTLEWVHPATGIRCKARLDRVVADQIIDIKTYGSTDTRQVASRIFQLRADLQLAHYREGLTIARSALVRPPLIVAAEDKAPFDVAVFELSEEVMEAAAREREALLQLLKDCEASGEWPGRHTEIQTIDLPAWRQDEEDPITGSEDDSP